MPLVAIVGHCQTIEGSAGANSSDCQHIVHHESGLVPLVGIVEHLLQKEVPVLIVMIVRGKVHAHVQSLQSLQSLPCTEYDCPLSVGRIRHWNWT